MTTRMKPAIRTGSNRCQGGSKRVVIRIEGGRYESNSS